jgi:hypothetical protein
MDVERARQAGASVLTGGHRLDDPAHAHGVDHATDGSDHHAAQGERGVQKQHDQGSQKQRAVQREIVDRVARAMIEGTVHDGDVVTFDVEKGQKGPRATNVVKAS